MHTTWRFDKRRLIYARINIKDDFRERGGEERRGKDAYVCACMYARRMGVPVEKGMGTVSLKRERKYKYSLRN